MWNSIRTEALMSAELRNDTGGLSPGANMMSPLSS